jgi:hypothetical protein
MWIGLCILGDKQTAIKRYTSKSWTIQPRVSHSERLKGSQLEVESRSGGQTIKQRLDQYFRQAVPSNLHFRQIGASNFTVRAIGDINNGRFFALLAAMSCFLSRQTNG